MATPFAYALLTPLPGVDLPDDVTRLALATVNLEGSSSPRHWYVS